MPQKVLFGDLDFLPPQEPLSKVRGGIQQRELPCLRVQFHMGHYGTVTQGVSWWIFASDLEMAPVQDCSLNVTVAACIPCYCT